MFEEVGVTREEFKFPKVLISRYGFSNGGIMREMGEMGERLQEGEREREREREREEESEHIHSFTHSHTHTFSHTSFNTFTHSHF